MIDAIKGKIRSKVDLSRFIHLNAVSMFVSAPAPPLLMHVEVDFHYHIHC